MDPQRLRALIEAAVAGRATVEETARALGELPFRELEFAHVDTHRHLRTGFPEVVLGEGKTPAQIAAILNVLREEEGAGRRLSSPPGSLQRRRRPSQRPCRAHATCRSRAWSWWARRRRPISTAASSPW